MNPGALRQLLTRQPFEPFRVNITAGKPFKIRHPEMASMAKNCLIVVLPDADGSPSDRVEFCSFLHIAGVESATLAE
jgi:hypothetical protein